MEPELALRQAGKGPQPSTEKCGKGVKLSPTKNHHVVWGWWLGDWGRFGVCCVGFVWGVLRGTLGGVRVGVGGGWWVCCSGGAWWCVGSFRGVGYGWGGGCGGWWFGCVEWGCVGVGVGWVGVLGGFATSACAVLRHHPPRRGPALTRVTMGD